jgi:maleylpyruvate isomerase
MAKGEVVAVNNELVVVMQDCQVAGGELRRAVGAVDEAALRLPSNLPGWTRGHVLAHITNIGDAAARQAEYARRGELIDVYDGGRPGRDAAIESDSALGLSAHRDRVRRMLDRVEGAWPPLESPLWDRAVTYRDGTVVDMALAWWREIRIHLVDLDLGIDASSWTEPFCRHLLTFLAVRLPSDASIELRPTGAEALALPGPVPRPLITISGDARDIASWLAGRTGRPLPVAALDGRVQALPTLSPWPSSR